MLALCAAISPSVVTATPDESPPPRVAVLRFIPEGRVPAIVVDQLTNATTAVARRNPSREVVTILDAMATIKFSPMEAVAGCEDDVLCLAQIGATLEVDMLTIGRVARDHDTSDAYAIKVFTVDVARSVIRRRITFALSGSAAEIEREFLKSIGDLFDDGAGASNGVPAHHDGAAQGALPEPPSSDAPAAPVAPIVIPAAPLPAFRDPDAPDRDPPTDSSSWRPIAGWSGMGLGVAACGLAVWQGLAALEAQTAYRNAATQVEAFDAKARGERAGLHTNIAWSVGGALAGIGALLVALDAFDGDDRSEAVQTDRDGVAIDFHGTGADITWRWSW